MLDLVSGVAAAGWGDGFLFRTGAEPGQDFPGGEAADELGMLRVGDLREVAGQPPLERADLLVHGREHAAGHQEFAQVGSGPPGLEGVERLVGQCYLALAEPSQ